MNRITASFVLLIGLVVGPSTVNAQPEIDLAEAPLEQLREVPGIDVVEIDFTDGLVSASGLVIHGDGPKPRDLALRSGPATAFASDVVDRSDKPWIRRFGLTITDDEFLNAEHAAVDIHFTYHLPAWGGVTVEARTPSGMIEVGKAWGDSKDWKTAVVSLEGTDLASVQGPHLRFGGANGRIALQRVRVIGHRGSGDDVNWSRLIRPTLVRAGTPDGIFAFERGQAGSVIELSNLASTDQPIDWSFRVSELDSNDAVAASSGTTTLPARQSSRFLVPFDLSGLPLGPYEATLGVLIDGREVMTMPLLLGVIEGDRTLPRAAPGDPYWFGLDHANTASVQVDHDLKFAYFDLLGVDILRGVPTADESQPVGDDRVADGLSRLREHGMRSAFIMFPDNRREKNPDRYEADKQRRIAKLASVAANFGGREPGQIPFIELGNEPDLPQFYPGPVEDYVNAYHEAVEAIREADPERRAKVMTGGLCFHTAVGDRRARRIIELLDPDKVDVWAFHGHGAGIEAERAAYERQVAAVRDHARGDIDDQLAKPFLETESGFNARSTVGRMEQARTTVEKQVYAMSVGMPSLYYFRLFMKGGHDGGYGMTVAQNGDEFFQPKPSILAYRHLVQRLRGFEFVQKLDVGVDGIEAYAFRKIGSNEKTLVAFSTKPQTVGLLVQLQAAAGVRDAFTFDLFGNATPARMVSEAVAAIDVGVNPVYLSWSGAGTMDELSVEPPMIAIRGDQRPRVLVGDETRLSLDVRPISGGASTATLRVAAFGPDGISVEPQSTAVSLDQGDTIDFELSVPELGVLIDTPRWWTVFVNADHDAVLGDAALRTSVPEALPAVSGERVRRLQLMADERGHVALEPHAIVGDRRPAVAYAVIDSPRDFDMPVGMSADWWSAWFVNGELLYDTLATGNEAGSVADHTFTMPLKKGRNVVCAIVLSGSGGFDFTLAGERGIGLVTSGGVDPHRLDLELVGDDGTVMTRQSVPLDLADPVPAGLPNVALELTEPVALLVDADVQNFHLKHPDSSRWYGGTNDLSSTVWLRSTGDKVEVIVDVVDDVRHEGDGVVVVLHREDGSALAAEPEPDQNGRHVARFDRAELPGTFRLNVRILDDDGQNIGLKQQIDLGDVDAPETGLTQRLR